MPHARHTASTVTFQSMARHPSWEALRKKSRTQSAPLARGEDSRIKRPEHEGAARGCRVGAQRRQDRVELAHELPHRHRRCQAALGTTFTVLFVQSTVQSVPCGCPWHWQSCSVVILRVQALLAT